MRTTTAPAKGTTKKKTRPVTVTINGELAATIREGAKQLGFRADTWARMCIESGDLVTSHTDEAKEFRRDMARHKLRISDELVELIENAALTQGSTPSEWLRSVMNYMLHNGNKFHITATKEQLASWSAAFKKSPCRDMSEWVQAVLNAEAKVA